MKNKINVTLFLLFRIIHVNASCVWCCFAAFMFEDIIIKNMILLLAFYSVISAAKPNPNCPSKDQECKGSYCLSRELTRLSFGTMPVRLWCSLLGLRTWLFRLVFMHFSLCPWVWRIGLGGIRDRVFGFILKQLFSSSRNTQRFQGLSLWVKCVSATIGTLFDLESTVSFKPNIKNANQNVLATMIATMVVLVLTWMIIVSIRARKHMHQIFKNATKIISISSTNAWVIVSPMT